MILDEALLMVATITHINTFWPRFNRKVTTVHAQVCDAVTVDTTTKSKLDVKLDGQKMFYTLYVKAE